VLAPRLRCPGCGEAELIEHPCPATGGSGTLECASCGLHHLVIDGVVVLTGPVPAPPEGEPVLEWADRDPAARGVVHAALGRFAWMLGGLAGCLEVTHREELEDAFDVPGAAWILLSRYSWPRNFRMPELMPGEGAVLDIGTGYGCSAVRFARDGREVVGTDENLFFLLLFSRYARSRDVPATAFVCIDAARLPFPFADGAFGGVLAASFFNHFSCLRPRGELRAFLDEVARVTRPGGTFMADMVPSRMHPFPEEINLGEVITEPGGRRLAERVVALTPTRWLPGTLTVPAVWALYRAYSRARGRSSFGLAAFREQIAKALPEVAVGGLPFTPRGWRRLLRGFSSVEFLDHEGAVAHGRSTGATRPLDPRAPYFVLRASR
jgi:SAM-dependent methyltransferase